MIWAMGKTVIKHADTGVVYEINGASLGFEVAETQERELGTETRHLAEFEYPELGNLAWEVWEYPTGVLNHHKTNVSPHKLLEDISVIIEDNPAKVIEFQNKMDALIKWFHENYEDPNNELPYDKEGEYGFAWVYGGPCDASEELQANFPDEDYAIIEAAVKRIQSDGMVAWSPIVGSEFFGEEPPSDDEIAEINSTLNTLIDTAPEPTTDPAFAFGEDNLLHIIDPPDNQPVDNQDDLLNELRAITDDLLQSLDGTNAHQPLERVVKQYKEAISGNQMSISRLYGRGVRLDNMAQIAMRDIEANELPSLPPNTEACLKTVIRLHGAYIMLNADGRDFVHAAADYQQPPEQPEGFKEAVEQFSNNVKNNSALFDENAREYVPNIVMDMGRWPYPERSDQIALKIITNVVSAVLKQIRNIGGKAIKLIVATAFLTSTPGQMAITAVTNSMNTIWSFLTNIAPSLKTFANSFPTQAPWLADVVQFLEYIKPIIGL